MLTLNSNIDSLFSVGKTNSLRLNRLRIETVGDLLYHIPYRYEDWSQIKSLAQAGYFEKASFEVTIEQINNIFTKSGKILQSAIASDASGKINIIWYNQPFLIKILKPGTKAVISGKIDKSFGKTTIQSPKYEIKLLGKINIHTGRIIGIYPETSKISSNWLRSRINAILFKISLDIPEMLPQGILKKYSLMGERQALEILHFPKNLESVEEAKRKLAFAELYRLRRESLARRKSQLKDRTNFILNKDINKEKEKIIKELPFKLTNSQNKVLAEIISDMQAKKPMNRLLEGDTGSGKTAVAAVISCLTAMSGFQAVILAPTEILAKQHFDTFKSILKNQKLKISLVTGSHKSKIKNPDIIIGTHAILFNESYIKLAGLIVADEQQKFGVGQREQIRKLGNYPHFLSMTATPIPRSLAMTILSDVDLSIITEMPEGRKKVKTYVLNENKRDACIKWMGDHIRKTTKSQAYVICPFIEKSENLPSIKDIKNQLIYFEKNLPSLKVEKIHGRQIAKKKAIIMKKFMTGKIDVLVATPLVEVGIDSKNADIMIIEDADRFGLAQLHQLRGRVGRGDSQAYCFLFSENKNENSVKRLKAMEKYHTGPQLAELDLIMRGAGEIFGMRQHGNDGFKFANLSDLTTIKQAKEASEQD